MVNQCVRLLTYTFREFKTFDASWTAFMVINSLDDIRLNSYIMYVLFLPVPHLPTNVVTKVLSEETIKPSF